jgi:serine/threonine protein phosphatase PrpC
VVSGESQAAVEAARQFGKLQVLRLGCRSQLLASLSVVREGAGAMNHKAGNARLFLGDQESCDLELPGGSVSVRSLRGPEKAGPNEDAAAVIPVSDTALVLAVADGVGGSPGGCEASTNAVESLQQSVAGGEQGMLRSTILDAMELTNRTLLEDGRRSATTLVVAEIDGNRLRCYHVGDSELIVTGQRGRIKQRIIPHSPTGFAVEAGLLNEQEAVQHEQRHILFNVIGAPDMRVDISTAIDLAPLDTVLLTSDGVLDNLFIDEIVNIVRIGPLDQAADRLVREARARMEQRDGNGPSKPDDITVVLYRRRRVRS